MGQVPSPLTALEDHLPSWLATRTFLELSLAQWLALVLLAAVAVLAGALGQRLLVWLARIVARRTGLGEDGILGALPGPARLLVALLVFHLFGPLLDLKAAAQAGVDVVVRILLIGATTWLIWRLADSGFVLLEVSLSRRITDANRLRSLQTQIALPRAILRIAIVVVGTALVLLQFDVVRSVGVSLLASAGLATVILGLAAQRAVGNLLAGIQLAAAQPIRIGDVVVVENEWGTVEEIGLTSVVVKLWDLRRLVLPVSYFLEKPFQNWTRGASDLLGTVTLHLDPSIQVDEVRAEVERILAQTTLWDRRTQSVQVTDLAATTVELRIVVSARDAAQLWDLRCHVREKLLAWLQARPARAAGS